MKALKLFPHFILPLLFVASLSSLRAQVGNNNPTGVAGMFNGNVSTGGSYDPYTGNATRTVTDMVVAGAVGDYGLSYSRTWNSRIPGGWQHPHNWGLEAGDDQAQPQSYTVTFPDGRQEYFTPSGGDIYYRSTPGIRERFIPWTPGNNYAYLILPDGGKVEFLGIRTYHQNEPPAQPPFWFEFQFTLTAIIDPHGRRTTFTTNADGSFQITEPAGRWIKVYHTATIPAVIDYVKASDNREVHYTHQALTFPPGTAVYSVLTNVAYYDDASLNATYTYRGPNVGNVNGVPLLATCDDPMYPGPMKQIKYEYRTKINHDGTAAVYGQISSETKPGLPGPHITTLSIATTDIRTEKRSDGKTRTFTYTDGYLTSWTDFKGIGSSQTYDAAKYIDSVTDGRSNTTHFTNNALTGAVIRVEYPATPNDTTPPTYTGGMVHYRYGGDAACQDPNNSDGYNPYYLCGVKDEAGNETWLFRDGSKQVTQINYPDGGYETFAYDYASYFGQVMTHRMKTGGIETFTYDATKGLRQTYRNPDNPGGSPTASYQYDALDRVSGVTDALGTYLGDPFHTTNYQYNSRGQLRVTTLPLDPVDGTRHTIVNDYNLNGDGTLVSVTDQLGHKTEYAYDDYRRPRSKTTPQRAPGDSTARITYFSYHRLQLNADDYTHTDANVTLLIFPSTNIVKTTYDENYRKSSVKRSAGNGSDIATTSYEYDNAGNLQAMLLPDEQQGQGNYGKSTTWAYDERNRLMTIIDPLNHYTHYTYDAFGRKKRVTQPNGQVITYDLYDSMNRVLQRTATQTPQPSAVTNYTYPDDTGLHMTMEDPLENNYVYEFDVMGRAKSLTYPPDSWGFNRTEIRTYDAAGRLKDYTNRDGKVQTFTYDALHRQTGFTWAAAAAPNVNFGYDAANRATSITNANAAISRTYFDDNLLKTETETPTGGTANTVTYAWNADGERESILYPSTSKYRYYYTGRDQLKQVQDFNSSLIQAEYTYDVNGNLATRKVGVNVGSFGVVTDTSQRDAMGRCTRVAHQFSGSTRTLDYVYDMMGNRSSIQRDGGTAEVYANDLAQQATAGVDNSNPHTYGYDANGNRTNMNGSGSYATNFLNQQTTFDGQAVTHNINGDVITHGSAAIYGYDAQNRLTSATVGAYASTFAYDGLNRKISQTINGVTTYNVWDGWNLIEERGAGNALINRYVYGAGEIVARITGSATYFYHQDGLGSTSHLSNSTGVLQEWYKYGTFGQTTVYAPNGIVRRDGSIFDVRHLYTGQLLMPATGLYDYRNRVFSPTLTRFLQPDPMGFAGDPSNLYRYCGNNSVNGRDFYGLDDEEDPKTPIRPLHVIVRGYGIGPETAETAGRYYQGPASPLNFTGGLFGEGSPSPGGPSIGFGPAGGFKLGEPLDHFGTPAPLQKNPFETPVKLSEPSTPSTPPTLTPPAATLPTQTEPEPDFSQYGKNWLECIRYSRDLATHENTIKNSNNQPVYNAQERMNLDISWWDGALLRCGPPPNPPHPAPYLPWHP